MKLTWTGRILVSPPFTCHHIGQSGNPESITGKNYDGKHTSHVGQELVLKPIHGSRSDDGSIWENLLDELFTLRLCPVELGLGIV
jgi:hypothetical protein